jgi:diguanylate cyclase
LLEANHAMEQRLMAAETTLHEQARQLEARSSEACTDSLTQLANRRAFNDELTRRFEEYERLQHPLSVILLDVDRFKQLNDTYGHPAGDDVLRGVASVLRQAVRGMDLVARYGGEEFGVVLPHTPLVVATAVAERMREAIAQHDFRYEGRVHRVTVSAGVAELRSSEQIPLLMRRADGALYASKQRGRNCTCLHNGREILPNEPSDQDRDAERNESRQPERPAPISRALPNPPSGPLPLPADDGSRDPYGTLDITDRRNLERLVRGRLAEWKRGGKSLTVAMVCVNELDVAVQSHGDNAGQLIVQTAARQLVSAVREMDTVAQYSDSCFAIVLPRTQQTQTVCVAERIQRFITECAVSIDGNRIPLSVSIGLTEAMAGDDFVRLLDRAYQTMDAARQVGAPHPYLHRGTWPEPLPSVRSSIDAACQVPSVIAPVPKPSECQTVA